MNTGGPNQIPETAIDETFPFSSYRPYQREILQEATDTLFGPESEYDNLVIYAPTGIGKSPINVALARFAENAFYTTPQKKLRHQLETDDTLRNHYHVLRAREDYDCEFASRPSWPVSCADCPVYHDDERACRNYTSGCRYWARKETAMDGDVATLTFSYLITDGYLPAEVETTDGTQQVSFDDRELLIVDECHQLENQAASLFAGFSVAPSTVTDDVYENLAERIPATATHITSRVRTEIEGLVQRVAVAATDFRDPLAQLDAAAEGYIDDATARERERSTSMRLTVSSTSRCFPGRWTCDRLQRAIAARLISKYRVHRLMTATRDGNDRRVGQPRRRACECRIPNRASVYPRTRRSANRGSRTHGISKLISSTTPMRSVPTTVLTTQNLTNEVNAVYCPISVPHQRSEQ